MGFLRVQFLPTISLTMKKITEQTARAFKSWQNCSISNSKVLKDWKFMRYYLFWNEIARLDLTCWQLCIRDCGRQSQTTKERLNWLLETFGLGYIFQKDWTWYFKNKNGVDSKSLTFISICKISILNWWFMLPVRNWGFDLNFTF